MCSCANILKRHYKESCLLSRSSMQSTIKRSIGTEKEEMRSSLPAVYLFSEN